MPHTTPLNSSRAAAEIASAFLRRESADMESADGWPFYTAATTSGTASNITIWRVWNAAHTTATATTTITQGQINWPFNQIIPAGTTAANISITGYAWNAWNEQHEQLRDLRAVTDLQTLQRFTQRKLSEAELKAALEQEKRWREEAEARARKAEEAKQRAEELLRACLSAEQREDLDKKKCFYILVEGKDGKKERYRIDRGSHGNVKQIDERGSIIRSFCIQPGGVPEGDVLLTQKLWLEASEETREEFWATANITTLMKEKEVPAAIPRRERRKFAQMNGLLH